MDEGNGTKPLRRVEVLRLVAGDPVLDFLNTRDGRGLPEPEVREALEEYGDLLRFAARTGLLTPEERTALEAKAAEDPSGAREALRRAREVRERLVRILGAVLEGRGPAPEDLASFEEDRRDMEARRGLAFGPRGAAWVWRDPADLHRPLWDLLRRGVDLFPRMEGTLRRCEAPDCDWFFLDRSPGGRRRWCCMETCGNRMKARRHYRRERGTGAPG